MPELKELQKGESPRTAMARMGEKLKHLIPVHRLSLESFVDFNRLVLFGATAREMRPLELRSDIAINKMTHDDLAALANGTGRFSDQAKLYYANRQIDTAYGGYLNANLVHMSWVYTSREYAKEPFQRLVLNDGEVEIVNCFTSEKCRGLGIYPYVIQFLSHLYFENGATRVYMMAHHDNFPSQRGIIKAGLRPVGEVTYVRIPGSSGKCVYYRRSITSH
jgi:hypothetical protein